MSSVSSTSSPIVLAAVARIAIPALLAIALSAAALAQQTSLEPETAASSPATQEGATLGVQEEVTLGVPAGPPRSGAELDSVTEALASEMRCPVCQGMSIQDSPSNMARDMRGKVQDLLAEGYSPEQVMTYFESTYGEFVRLEPKARGFNLVVWIAPVAVLAVGLALTTMVVRGRSTKTAPSSSDEDLAALREQVRREVES